MEDGGYPNSSQEILWTLEKQRKWFIDLPPPFFYNSEVEQNNTASEEWLTGVNCVAFTRQLASLHVTASRKIVYSNNSRAQLQGLKQTKYRKILHKL